LLVSFSWKYKTDNSIWWDCIFLSGNIRIGNELGACKLSIPIARIITVESKFTRKYPHLENYAWKFENKKISIRETEGHQLIRWDMTHSEILSRDKRERGFAFLDLKLVDRIDGSVWWEHAGDFYGPWNFIVALKAEYISRVVLYQQLSSQSFTEIHCDDEISSIHYLAFALPWKSENVIWRSEYSLYDSCENTIN